jgi:hypothetical protein
MKWLLLLLALTACDPEPMTITMSRPAKPVLDKRDQYALARAIVSLDPEGDPDAFAQLTKAWQGRRFRWEVAYLPALCTHPDRCMVAPFDHARFERPIAQGWLPRLVLDEATFRAVRERCRSYRQCILEVDARLDELRLSNELPTRVTLTEAKLTGAREARADESWIVNRRRVAPS